MSDAFTYKEFDDEGFETLKVISDAENFNQWTFEVIQPYCTGKILEIGSGIGNISERFISKGLNIHLTEIRSHYRDFLSQKFPELLKENKISDLDLAHPDFINQYANLLESFDTVFALNVVEHIQDANAAIANCNLLLKPGGKLIILVPAFKWLYNTFDKELHHYKRYNQKELRNIFSLNNFQNNKSFYFNAAGIPGWFVSGNLQKNKTIPAGQMNLFNKLVPLFKITDKLLLNTIGLSVICVGSKK